MQLRLSTRHDKPSPPSSFNNRYKNYFYTAEPQPIQLDDPLPTPRERERERPQLSRTSSKREKQRDVSPPPSVLPNVTSRDRSTSHKTSKPPGLSRTSSMHHANSTTTPPAPPEPRERDRTTSKQSSSSRRPGLSRGDSVRGSPSRTASMDTAVPSAATRPSKSHSYSSNMNTPRAENIDIEAAAGTGTGMANAFFQDATKLRSHSPNDMYRMSGNSNSNSRNKENVRQSRMYNPDLGSPSPGLFEGIPGSGSNSFFDSVGVNTSVPPLPNMNMHIPNLNTSSDNLHSSSSKSKNSGRRATVHSGTTSTHHGSGSGSSAYPSGYPTSGYGYPLSAGAGGGVGSMGPFAMREKKEGRSGVSPSPTRTPSSAARPDVKRRNATYVY